jgi:hypothetical protein
LASIVQKEDLAYLQSLLRDFKKRARLDPASLFKQLSTLSVGPLVTGVAGEELADYPALQALTSTFAPL